MTGGYAIARRMEQVCGNDMQLSQESVYPALMRLEQEGWIATEWGVSKINRRVKFYPPDGGGTKTVAAGDREVGEGDGDVGAVPGEAVSYMNSDLLLHDMGPGLADGFVQTTAGGSEFRTMPLWRVADRQHFLHHGRASTLTQFRHTEGATSAFHALGATELQALLNFCI